MSKYTPGPWQVEGNTVYALESAGRHRGVERMQNRFSAIVQSPRTSSVELEANARLIAAAPELLEALIDALCALECCGKDYPAAEKARAAIAKARGEA